ncbi:MAG: hypothetical protein K2Y01_07770 [Rhabdochlamydiaceae bacterium]|nr:hypothetical protein [Rhabdochlamydiaceae bacterium]
MKENKSLKIYVNIGKVLCAIAGGIVGFVVGGPFLVLPGTAVGVISAYFFKQSILSNVF